MINTMENKNLDVLRMIHEVKNSFAVCSGYLDIIDANKGEDVKKYISVIRNEIDRSNSLIREFMLGSDTNIIKNVIDVRLFLDSVCRELELYVNNKSISFEYDIDVFNVNILGDCNKLKQVLINLVKNSVEACFVGGNIIVSSYIDDKFCFIEVIDDGIGIDSDVLERIGNRFFTTKSGGNGLGVNFCMDVIEKHDGYINYYSKKDCGTKVVVKLPIIVL